MSPIGKFANPVSNGGTTIPASTTPTLSIAQAAFGNITATISNYASYTNPNFSAEAKVGSLSLIKIRSFPPNYPL